MECAAAKAGFVDIAVAADMILRGLNVARAAHAGNSLIVLGHRHIQAQAARGIKPARARVRCGRPRPRDARRRRRRAASAPPPPRRAPRRRGAGRPIGEHARASKVSRCCHASQWHRGRAARGRAARRRDGRRDWRRAPSRAPPHRISRIGPGRRQPEARLTSGGTSVTRTPSPTTSGVYTAAKR